MHNLSGEGGRIPSPARVLLPLGLAMMFSLMGDQTLYASLAAHRDVVGISVAAVGVMLGVNRLVRIPSNPLGGMLADRWGRRRPFLVGLAAGAVSTAICALASGFWPMLAGRLLWGLSWTLINMSALSMLLDLTVQTNRGRIAGFFQMAYLLGLASTALVSGFLVDAIGFRQTLWLGAGVTAAGFLAAALALPETLRARDRTARPFKPLLAGVSLGFLRALDRRILATTLMYMVTNFAGNGVVMSTVALLLRTRYGDFVPLGASNVGVSSLAGTLLGLGPLLGIVTGPAAGRLSDSPRGRWRIIVWGFVLGCIAFGALAVDRSLGLIIGGIALVSAADGILLPTLMAQAGDLAHPERRGREMGLYATGGDVGSAAGPFVAFALARAFDLRWVYGLCAGLYLAALALALWMQRQQRAGKGQPGAAGT